MQIADIPERWQTVLRYVQNVAPDAVIAGGALRDLDNGRPVKDIDIFVQGNAMADLRSLREKLIELGFDCDDTDDQKIYPVGEDKTQLLFRLRYDRAGLMLVTSIHRYARLSQKYEAWKFELFDPFDTVLGAMCR